MGNSRFETVRFKVINVVADQLGLAVNDIQLTSTLVELGADSLDAVELLMALEEEFSIELPDEEALLLATVDQLVTSVLTRTENRASVSDAKYHAFHADGLYAGCCVCTTEDWQRAVSDVGLSNVTNVLKLEARMLAPLCQNIVWVNTDVENTFNS